MDNFEEKIKDSLMRGTNDCANQKDIVYQRLINNINTKGYYNMRRNRPLKKVLTAAAVFIAVLVIFFTVTPTGRVLAQNIIKYFAPEKQIENEVEGQRGFVNADLFINTVNKIGYAIYIDTELYTVEKTDDKDIIKAKNIPDTYPSVQMEIFQVLSKTPDELINQYMSENQGKYKTVRNDGEVTYPIKSLKITLIKGSSSRDVYEKIFIVSNNDGGSFVIHQKLFVEAEEGHGARFDNMLKTFEVFISSDYQPAK
ncbi:MAG: hypothetical protein AAGU14_11020 [Eubacteriaceae bacterium]